MKKALIIIAALLPAALFGQQLKCCQTTEEVEAYLTGKWKVKDSDSKYVYHYWFEDGKGNVEQLEIPQEGVEVINDDEHFFVEIIKYDKGFKLKYIYLYGDYVSDLKYLNSNKLILITDGKETEYYKIAE